MRLWALFQFVHLLCITYSVSADNHNKGSCESSLATLDEISLFQVQQTLRKPQSEHLQSEGPRESPESRHLAVKEKADDVAAPPRPAVHTPRDSEIGDVNRSGPPDSGPEALSSATSEQKSRQKEPVLTNYGRKTTTKKPGPHIQSNCIIDTGVKCKFDDQGLIVEGCDDLGAEAVCKRRGEIQPHAARCECKHSCATANATCVHKKYEVILEHFTLRDYRYGRYLRASLDEKARWGLGLTRHVDPGTFFTMMRTPDGAFIIYSDNHLDHAIAIETWWGYTDSDEERDRNHYVTEADKAPKKTSNKETFWDVILPNVRKEWRSTGERGADPDKFETSAPAVALTLTTPPRGYSDKRRPKGYSFNGTYPVMLQSHMFPQRFIYVDFYGEPGERPKVAHNDPGDGALWVFDPPLPTDLIVGNKSVLQEFHGDRCDHNCVGPNSLGQMSTMSYYVIWGMLAIGVLVCTVFIVLAIFMPQYNFV